MDYASNGKRKADKSVLGSGQPAQSVVARQVERHAYEAIAAGLKSQGEKLVVIANKVTASALVVIKKQQAKLNFESLSLLGDTQVTDVVSFITDRFEATHAKIDRLTAKTHAQGAKAFQRDDCCW